MTAEEFAAVLLEQRRAALLRQYPDSPFMAEEEAVQVKPGPTYTKVDVGPRSNMSGKYMIENATGAIFGIKGYGKVHKGHQYGTLETVETWDWSGYVGRPL